MFADVDGLKKGGATGKIQAAATQARPVNNSPARPAPVVMPPLPPMTPPPVPVPAPCPIEDANWQKPTAVAYEPAVPAAESGIGSHLEAFTTPGTGAAVVEFSIEIGTALGGGAVPGYFGPIAGAVGVAGDVAWGIADNIQGGAPTGQTVLDAAVDTAFGAAGFFAAGVGAAGGAIGGPIGSAIGAVAGGAAYTFSTDVITINGYTISDFARKHPYLVPMISFPVVQILHMQDELE